MDYQLVENLKHNDLHIYQCGTYQCEGGHAYGPAVRDHYLIHYIHSGKGIFQIGSQTYSLHAGNGFLICPDIVTYYKADDLDPWHYSWIGFHGLKAKSYLLDANLTLESPVFEYLEDDFIDRCFQEMNAAYNCKRGGEVQRLAYLYLFLNRLIQCNPEELTYPSADSRRQAYINTALQYIEMNYSRKITVDSIAQHVGLNRSYFNSLFKSVLQITLQEYLIEFRIRKACELLSTLDLSVGDISRSVGYTDPFLFSKMFKQIKGMSPSEYRQRLNDEALSL